MGNHKSLIFQEPGRGAGLYGEAWAGRVGSVGGSGGRLWFGLVASQGGPETSGWLVLYPGPEGSNETANTTARQVTPYTPQKSNRASLVAPPGLAWCLRSGPRSTPSFPTLALGLPARKQPLYRPVCLPWPGLGNAPPPTPPRPAQTNPPRCRCTPWRAVERAIVCGKG